MSSKTKIYIGTSGWSYDHWVERFYPEDLKKNEWFPHYTQHFNTVELNMSFYRYPFQNMLKGWRNKMPEDFQMTFKANRQITHRKKFHEVEDPLKKFYEMTTNMGENTGCILFQTPPSFKYDDENFRTLLKFMDILDSSYKNVMEFRDPAWWNEEVIKLLKAHNVAFCTVSGLEMPPDVVVTANFGYFRFHGPKKPYASIYSDEELNNWAEEIAKKIKENNLEAVYCYFNNDYFGYALQNAEKLKNLLHGKLHLE